MKIKSEGRYVLLLFCFLGEVILKVTNQITNPHNRNQIFNYCISSITYSLEQFVHLLSCYKLPFVKDLDIYTCEKTEMDMPVIRVRGVWGF